MEGTHLLSSHILEYYNEKMRIGTEDPLVVV